MASEQIETGASRYQKGLLVTAAFVVAESITLTLNPLLPKGGPVYSLLRHFGPAGYLFFAIAALGFSILAVVLPFAIGFSSANWRGAIAAPALAWLLAFVASIVIAADPLPLGRTERVDIPLLFPLVAPSSGVQVTAVWLALVLALIFFSGCGLLGWLIRGATIRKRQVDG